jgi:hypothetical protein
MFIRSTTALSAALVLATACVAPAIAKDRVHQRHGGTVVLSVPQGAYQSYGLAPAPVAPNATAGRIQEPLYMMIQTQGAHNGG